MVGFTKTKSNYREWVARCMLVFIGVTLAIGALALLQPSLKVSASTDSGLDSGNAVVDRTSVPGQTILKYTTTGNSTFKAPAGVTDVRVLVVGGGGGGGAGELNNAGDAGGGGGAGEYRHESSFSVTPGVATTVTVGGGGNGSTTNQNDGGTTAQNGAGGSNSIFGSLTARAGGGGGGNDQNGLSGGSGGGGGGHCTSTSTTGGASTAVAPGIGKAGGNSPSGSCSPRGAAGGGGANAIGTSGSGGSGGAGGAGLQNDITGTNAFYAAGGGGGGGSSSGGGANGGSGIGGKGGNASGGNGVVGTANTGSGGGGGGSTSSTSSGNGGNGGSGIVIVRFATQNTPDPGGVTGMRMWYKADSVGNTNAQWNDSSGFGYNLTQGTVGNQPSLTTNALNFNPAYMFDGTDDVFRMPTPHGIGNSDSMSAFYAATSTTTAGGDRYFNEFGDDRPSITIYNGKPRLYVRDTSSVDDVFATEEALKPHVYGFISPNNGGTKLLSVDSREQTKSITGSYTTGGGAAGVSFGGRNASAGTSWQGPIAEAIYFNKQLSAQERQRVDSYLAIKYGITLGTGDKAYVDSTGATVWAIDSTFKNNIAGIGRDDASTLNQKQSKSSSDGDIVTIGHGTIAATNQANTNDFSADRSFQMWAHNGASTGQNTTVTGTSMKRIDRIWKSTTTGTVGQVKIQVPTSTLGGTNPKLLVSNNTTFDNTSQVVNMTTVGGNYEALVTLTGAKYFTFASSLGSDIQFVSKTATDAGGTPITNYTPGESMQYVLSIKNNGPENAGTVTVTDTLPDGILPVAATGGGWTCPPISGQTVTCHRSALNANITAPDLIIEATIASSVSGQKINTANASVAVDPDPTNNSASLTMDTAFKSDLSISKEDTTGPANPTAGTDFDYKLTVTNNGPSDLTSYSIADTLPSDLTFVSATPNICGGSSGQNVTCTDPAGITNGQSKVVTVKVHVDPAYNNANPLTNTATVSVPSGVLDPNMSNNSSTNVTDVEVSADLTVDKTHSGNFTAGTNSNNFTITVNNGGPSAAPANTVTISDTLDTDLSYQSFTGTDWSCTNTTGTITCDYAASIAASGSSSPLTLTVAVDPLTKGSIDNTVDVSSTAPDPNTGNNSDTDTVTVESNVDLGITKAHVNSTFTAGGQEEYNFTVTNNGPSADTPSFTVTDTLPAGLSFVSATGDASCAPDGVNPQIIHCTGGGITVGETLNFTMTVLVAGNAASPLENNATVAPAPGTTDTNPGNDSANDSVNVTPNADLSITKQFAGNLTAGDNETYTITVHNDGPSDVSSFTVTDTLDDNLEFQPTTGCTELNQVVTCTGSTLTSGSDAIINLNVKVDASTTPGSSIDNTATVAVPSSVHDPDLNNNSDLASNAVEASANLSLTKTANGNFTAGTNTNTYTIEVTNAGPSDASTFTVTDTLPAGLTYIDATGQDVECTYASPTVTCTSGPTISAGQSTTITLTVGVAANQANGSTFDNTATVNSATFDPNTGNETDDATATVATSADLGIEKTNTDDFVAGNNETYNFKITNAGPSDVTSFTVTDDLPDGLTLVSSSPNICGPVSGTNITCTGPALPSGQEYNFTMTVSVPPGLAIGTPIANIADVAPPAGTTDSNMSNNESTDNTNIVGVADLAATKAPGAPLVAGKSGQYIINVTNNGPTDVPSGDITVTDTLPDGITFDSTSTPNWNCLGSGTSTATCTYNSALTNGNSTQLTLDVDIPAATQGEVTNSATVTSAYDDPNSGNDTGTSNDTVTAEADLTATKQALGPITAGEPVTYRFEVANNSGPSVANNVTITDDLDGELTFQSVADESWDCNQHGETLTCDLSFGLVVGNSVYVDVTFLAAQDAPNPLENTASVTFNGTDPTPANPSDTQPVSYEADLGVRLTHESKTYQSGDTVKFTYTVDNYGPSAAKDVVLTDTLPEGLSFESIVASHDGPSVLDKVANIFFVPLATSAAPNTPFNCSNSGQDITCNTDTLLVGTYTITMTAKIADNFTGDLTSMLQITSSTPDPNMDNNSSSDTIVGVTKATGTEGGVLADTGEDIIVWVAAGLIVLTLAASLITRIYRKRTQVV